MSAYHLDLRHIWSSTLHASRATRLESKEGRYEESREQEPEESSASLELLASLLHVVRSIGKVV